MSEYFLKQMRHKGMTNKLSSVKIAVSAMVASVLLSNCSTYYDANGVPVQAVDPVAATVGAAALGVVAYAIADNNRSHRSYHRSNRGRYRGY